MKSALFVGPPEVKGSSRFEQLGAVCHLVSRCRYQIFAAGCMRIWVEPAIELDQIRIYYNAQGDPVGYITWAWLAPEVGVRLATDPQGLLHISEWTEGAELWILDVVAPSGHAADMALEALECPLFQHAERIRYVRRRADGSVFKVGCLRNPRSATRQKMGSVAAGASITPLEPC